MPQSEAGRLRGGIQVNTAYTYMCTYVCTHMRASHVLAPHPPSYLASTLREQGFEPMPSLYDVRRVVTELCILPLGQPLPRGGHVHRGHAGPMYLPRTCAYSDVLLNPLPSF